MRESFRDNFLTYSAYAYNTEAEIIQISDYLEKYFPNTSSIL